MIKSKTQPSFRHKDFRTPKAPTKFKSRNLAAISPNKEQFEPTEGMPVPQHHKMAGGT